MSKKIIKVNKFFLFFLLIFAAGHWTKYVLVLFLALRAMYCRSGLKKSPLETAFSNGVFFGQNGTCSNTPYKTSVLSVEGELWTVCFLKTALVFAALSSSYKRSLRFLEDLSRPSFQVKYGVFKVGFEYSPGCFFKLECTPSRKEECRRTSTLGEGNVPPLKKTFFGFMLFTAAKQFSANKTRKRFVWLVQRIQTLKPGCFYLRR